MAGISDQLVTINHVERKPGVCGGKPCIAGTRIRVWDIHVLHNIEGRRPEEIVAAFPHISVADIHAALAYYYDNREVIDREMREAEEFALRLQAEQGPTRFSQLRDKLRAGGDGNGDPVSS
jgi:uncharacterized protein (DUF433 family)